MNNKKILIAVGTIVCATIFVIVLSIFLTGSYFGDQDEPPKLIVISFDGFRADYVSPTLTPTLWSLKQTGVTGRMFPQFISKTFPNHFSIATGLYEESHGIVANNMYDPELNLTFDLSHSTQVWWDNGYSLPLWIANQKKSNRKSGAIMWPGCGFTFGGDRAFYSVEFNRSIDMKGRVDILMNWFTDKTNPANLVFLYIENPDDTAHKHGPFGNETLAQVRMADEAVAYLLENLDNHNLTSSTNIILVSDHGMEEFKSTTTVNLTELVPDQTSFQQFGGSQAISILPNPGVEDQVYQMFNTLGKTNHFRVYKRDEIPEEYHYRDNIRIQPILLEAEPGYEIAFSSWKHPDSMWGNHGNNNTQPEMEALFIASGPQFKDSFNLNGTSFFNIDLYPIMVDILNLNVGNYKCNGTDLITRNLLAEL
ncbi:ectonucleotide pyrophosphatase/phosphodiesterase family member 5-like [Panonychus citri]|uniref:ectonucleotide pyrophosphatase/phosphodiesterase family member 5-like n=1 Tax=Panonychus citri TaxID=50023 RepID=UPI002307F8EE|nr:ectonucleotide pyrophosphatase/phosphodiesterase family member 5-like [Panonychus citri]XP_053204064.1 ectonucleotide pyrophosphatase/phosphodiesterase family member 5-like [Panonychus citri]